jgi:DNA-binding NarL/FixJ family response regulator
LPTYIRSHDADVQQSASTREAVTGLGQVIRVESEVLKKMPAAGDYLKGRYSQRTQTVMRLLREGQLSQTKIAKKVGVSKQRVWTINKKLSEGRKA